MVRCYACMWQMTWKEASSKRCVLVRGLFCRQRSPCGCQVHACPTVLQTYMPAHGGIIAHVFSFTAYAISALAQLANNLDITFAQFE